MACNFCNSNRFGRPFHSETSLMSVLRGTQLDELRLRNLSGNLGISQQALAANNLLSSDAQALGRCGCGCGCGCCCNCCPVSVCGLVTTGIATGITETAATIESNAIANFTTQPLAVGVEYAINPLLCQAQEAFGPNTSPFSVSLTGLTANTTYYYRAFADIQGRRCYGSILSFVTAEVQQAVVTTGNAVGITPGEAQIVNNVYTTSGGVVLRVGIQYALNSRFIGSLFAFDLPGSPFQVTLFALQPGQTYFYRAFIDHNGQRIFSNVVRSFTTPGSAGATVTTGTAANITSNAADVAGNTFAANGETVLNVGVEYAVNPTFVGSVSLPGALTSPFSVDLSGLAANTTYYYRAFANTSGGKRLGEIKSFTTQSGAPATVTTGTAGSITSGTSSINNNSFAANGDTILSAGVEYATNIAFSGSQTTMAPAAVSPFNIPLTGLIPNTTYYFRAFVNTLGGVRNGVTGSFTTTNV